MKNQFIFILVCLFLILSISSAIFVYGQDDQKELYPPNNFKTERANYMIAKYVIGSGGVLGASGPNHFHSATAGEMIVGGSQGANHILLSGFWHVSFFRPIEVAQKKTTNMPGTFELHQNYPNPFNPQTIIEYDLTKTSIVNIEIYNLAGQRIRDLVNSQTQGPGFLQVVWDGRDDQGNLMSSGIYIYRISVYARKDRDQKAEILYQQSKKMSFVK